MARGRKNYTLEEQLDMINENIELTEENLEQLKQEKEELEEQIKINRLMELDKLIQQSGKSYDEVREFICCEG